jgi:hypothetical protein
MAAGKISNVVELLSTTANIGAGATFETNRVLIQEYSSITLSVFADQALTILVQFSNDSTNWDISVTKNFLASIGAYESLVILGKWCRLQVTNDGGSATTSLRVFTYASVENTSLNALIQKVGNKSPEISVDNFPLGAFGDLACARQTARSSYVFVAGNSSIPKDNDIQTFYPDLQAGDVGASATPAIDFTDRCINLRLNGDLNNPCFIQGGVVPYEAGVGCTFRFTMKFALSDSDLGSTLLVGAGYISGAVRSDFFGFGWVSDGTPNTYNNFGISYTIAGSTTTVLRTSWNGDRADGTGDLAALDTTKINLCQIKQTYLGSGPIVFYIMNSAGSWILVHTLQFPNTRTATTARDPSFGVSMYASLPAGAVISSGADAVSCGSFGAQHDAPHVTEISRHAVEYSGIERSIAAATETLIFSLENSTIFQGASINTPLSVDEISASGSGSGNNNLFIRIYVDATIGTPTWTSIDNFSSMNRDEVGTFSGGRLVESFPIERNGKAIIKLPDAIILYPGRTATITAYSAGSASVFVSVNYHVI